MRILRRVGWVLACALPVTAAAVQSRADSASQILQFVHHDGFAGFQSRVDEYVQVHRRVAARLPPLAVTTNLDDVHRRMDALRARIRAERRERTQGDLFRPEVIARFREVVAGSMTGDDIRNAMEDIDEHVPPGMRPLRINEPLPEDAPFGMVPPALLRALPPLPDELRYMVLSKAILIWDQHADLVVDIAAGVFDAGTYAKPKSKE